MEKREAILFFLIVVINRLKCIVSYIGLDTCANGRWRVEVSKLELLQIHFRSIIQFLVVLFPLLLCLHQHIILEVLCIEYWEMFDNVKIAFFCLITCFRCLEMEVWGCGFEYKLVCVLHPIYKKKLCVCGMCGTTYLSETENFLLKIF